MQKVTRNEVELKFKIFCNSFSKEGHCLVVEDLDYAE